MKIYLTHPLGFSCYVTDDFINLAPGQWLGFIGGGGIGPAQDGANAAIRHLERYIREDVDARLKKAQREAAEMERVLAFIADAGPGWLTPYDQEDPE
jgi:hypothetical protein